MRQIAHHSDMGWESPITLVSGLPRSGTSLLMQMLQAGGAELLVDRVRGADAHNPRGYFEFEPVKRLKDDASWLPLAQGKVVKVISHFLEFLPLDHRYNVIFLRRDLDEVLASQREMLRDYGDEEELIPDEEMKFLFRKHLGHLEGYLHDHKCFRTLYLEHRAILGNPHEAAVDINFFLGGGLDVASMAKAVDHKLYRNRA